MHEIIPTILTSAFTQFKNQLSRLESLFPIVQIDVMDGFFVANKSFEEIEKIKFIKTGAKFELHLMVENPLQEMEKWSEIPNIYRVIFHVEAQADIEKCLAYARGKCWQVGLALNPETSLSKVEPYLDKINSVLFLTVHPGRQGAPFVAEVKNKIKEFTKLKHRPLCAADGGINKENILALKNLGVEIFCVGGALVNSENIKETYEELKNIIK